jgi:hypothetical protein
MDSFFFNGTNPSLTDNYTFNQTQFAGYSKLDYILVGGGGGGAATGQDFVILCCGGGGSGNLKSSFSFNATNSNFIYDIPNTNEPTISLTGVTSINIAIGDIGEGAISPNSGTGTNGKAGGNTILTITGGSANIVTAPGGEGGLGGDNEPEYIFGGLGGIGYNGGGGGAAGQEGQAYPPNPPDVTGGLLPGGDGDIAFGGTNGNLATQIINTSMTSGAGGGDGGGLGATINWTTSPQSINIGGGGGAGTCVKLVSGNRTGGDGTGGVGLQTGLTPPTVIPATSGVPYTGAGGGGGAGATSGIVTFTSVSNGGNGGKGYAILYFHN